MTKHFGVGRVGEDRVFRWAAALFVVVVAVHGADHLRRGMNIVPPVVMVAGMVQIVLAAVTVALVFSGSRRAPRAAIVVGFVSAAGFTVAHLLPAWGFLSDSFINAPPSARVTWFSWVSAICEVLADIAFGLVGVAILVARRHATNLTAGVLR